MADQLDSGQLVSDDGANGDKLASPDLIALKEELKKEIISEVSDTFDKKYQSMKDKHLSNIDKDVAALKDSIKQKLETAGVTKDEIEKIITEKFGQLQEPQLQPAVKDNLSDAKKSVLEIAGIAEDDPDILALNERKLSYNEWVAAVKNIVAAGNEPPTPGSVQVPNKGTGSKLTAEDYKKEMMAARGMGSNAAAQIRQKYFDAGVDIDNVSFQ